MLRRIWNLAVKEFIQLARDRMMALLLLLLPLAQLVLLAQAAGQGVNNLALAVLDWDRSPESRRLVESLANIPEFRWRYSPANEQELADLLDRGRVTVGLVIPAGFGNSLASAPTVVQATLPVVQVIVDGSNSLVGAAAQSAAEGTISAYVRRLAEGRGLGSVAPVALRTAVRYNPGLDARLFTIPAQMGFIIYQVTLAVASLTFARERELGTLEALLVTPLRRIELISGKAVLAWLVGLVDFLFMYLIARQAFQIPMRGSFALLLACSLLFVTVEIGYGVIISSFAHTQQQAVLYVFMLAMLDVALCGYLVPVKNMPALFRYAAQASPLQHYLVVIRSIMLKGAGLDVLWRQLLALAIIGAVVASLAIGSATRTLE